MIELRLSDLVVFFIVAAACISMIVIWIMNSETKRKICKLEISKLKGQLDSSERQNFILAEKLDELKDESFTPENIIKDSEDKQSAVLAVKESIIEDLKRKNEELESENNRIKSELHESKSSLEEVYKALCQAD